MAYTLKYFLEFYDPSETLYRTEILEDTALSLTPIELEGASNPVSFNSPDKDDIFTPLVGSALTLRFIATEDFTLSDLYTESETKYMVKHYRGSVLLWQGFIIPDGAQQSWTSRVWEIQLDCVDGLGLLKNLGFVDNTSGNPFLGKQSYLEVITNCLKRTSLGMNINTSVNIFYGGSLPGLGSNPNDFDTLTLSHIQVERFYKDDGQTPMNCDEVLKSLLDEFKAVIVQRRGEWFVCKWNELYANANVSFRAYNSNGSRQANKAVNLSQSIYSYDGTNATIPHHSGENQILFLEKAYKKLSINYKYGTVASLISNPNFIWPIPLTLPVGWFLAGSLSISKPAPELGQGIRIHSPLNYANFLYSGESPVGQGDLLTLIVEGGSGSNQGTNTEITLFLQTSGTDYFLAYENNAYVWKTFNGSNKDAVTFIFPPGDPFYRFEDQLPPTPVAGNIRIEVYGNQPNLPVIIKYLNLIPSDTSQQPVKGEYHEVTQPGNYSFVPDNLEVYNGDNPSGIWVGTIYKANEVDPTSEWHRFGFAEGKPLLQIAAEDTLRMFQRQRRKFTGNFYGYFDYLSVIEIVGITGKYVPTGMTFDFATNEGSFTLREIIADELPGITYELKPDYGNAIKPVIR